MKLSLPIAVAAAGLSLGLILGLAGALTAQTVPPPGTSAEQIRRQITGQGLRSQLQSRINASGLTPDQIRQRLGQLGYDPATLDPYLNDADDDPPDPSENVLTAVRSLGVMDAPSTAVPETPATSRPAMPEPSAEEREEGLRVFGLQVFSRSTTQFQPVTSGPVPTDYVLGPGDELILILTGDVENAYTLPVTREGFIIIPQVGQVWVNGLTLEQLRAQMYTHLGRAYSGIRRGPEATTHFQLTLGQLRTNQVFVTGEVAQPGSYLVSPVASVLNALYHAGGPTANGSFREVRIVRGGQVAHRVDVYEYLLEGNNLNHLRLEPGDVVFVPVHHPHVAIRGEVPRPAIYELLPGGTLADLVHHAGGLNAPAHLRRARITRILPPAERGAGVERTVIDVSLADVVSDPGSAPELRPGDEVRIFPVRTQVRNTVALEGAVWHPGSYEYQPGMRAWDLIRMGEGLQPEAYLSRAQIVRVNPVDSTLSIVPFALDTTATGAPVEDPELREYDALRVFSNQQLRRQQTVEVRGAVRDPGPIRSFEGITLRDAILRAGGLDERTYTDRAYISRLQPDSTRRIIPVALDVDSLNVPINADPLREHDIVQVYGTGRFVDRLPVSIHGQVREPGGELFHEGMTLDDLLIRAGGITPQASLVVEISRLTDAGRQLEGELAEVLTVRIDSSYLVTEQGMRYYPGGRADRRVPRLEERADTVPDNDTDPDNGPLPAAGDGSNGDPAPGASNGAARAPSAAVAAAMAFELRPFDHVHVRRLPDFSLPANVVVTGKVMYPGEYTLERRGERLTDVLDRAGGFATAAYPGGFRLYRDGSLVNVDLERVLRRPDHRDNLELLPGDSMHVPIYNPVVRVQGAVQSPSAILYSEGAGLGYYIDQAGGYTRDADEARVHVRFANGEGATKRSVLVFKRSPTPLPGSVVTVPAVPEGDRVNVPSLISDIAQIAATLTTIALIIARL